MKNDEYYFQTMYCFSSGTDVHLGHCIIFCYALGPPPPSEPPIWRAKRHNVLETELVCSLWRCDVGWCIHILFVCLYMLICMQSFKRKTDNKTSYYKTFYRYLSFKIRSASSFSFYSGSVTFWRQLFSTRLTFWINFLLGLHYVDGTRK